MEEKVFVCECTSLNHIIHIAKFEGEEEVYLHLKSNIYQPFFKRLIQGLKFIFKKTMLDYDEVILNQEKTKELINFLQK